MEQVRGIRGTVPRTPKNVLWSTLKRSAESMERVHGIRGAGSWNPWKRSVESAEQVRGVRGVGPWIPRNRSAGSAEQVRGIHGVRGAGPWSPWNRSAGSVEQVNGNRGTDPRGPRSGSMESAEQVHEAAEQVRRIYEIKRNLRNPRSRSVEHGAGPWKQPNKPMNTTGHPSSLTLNTRQFLQ